ncbi:putative oxalocrotonate tautomerase [Lentinula aciculospora]|uniref:Oxalocrotonate tautomerase n=1 Tax=Lentinula aciculospora TaxID=153920 RepID=A0A9W9DQV6_9AGAR|nr:putative oxalocrotonate tautomerase [Lentinula aciculospora]
MPFHRFYCSANLYTKEEKQAIARSITNLYALVPLPRFYVVVNFIEVGQDDCYVSGEQHAKFLRIHVQHLARNLQTVEEKRVFLANYEKAIAPYTKDKGIDWELQVSNEDPAFWNWNGISPPPFGSEPFQMWMKVNKPVEWAEEVLQE